MAKNQFPTGFSPDALPIYERLDDARFEQFCADLLNLHPVLPCLRNGHLVHLRVAEADRLLSGRAQKGSDIRAVMEGGEVWYFQCKKHKSFSATQTRAALRLMETQSPGGSQFVLITACGLDLPAQEFIRSSARYSWWDPSRLTQFCQEIRPVESAHDLVLRYFQDWTRRLFPWPHQPILEWPAFFARELAEDASLGNGLHRHTCIPQARLPQELLEFASGAGPGAAVLSAPGGRGKSRLLLEFARSAEESPRRVRFLRHDLENPLEGSREFFAREKNLLLIIDDAHRLNPGDIGRLAAWMRSEPSHRLILATRPSARVALASELDRAGYDGKAAPLPWTLERPDVRAMEELAETLLPDRHHLVPELVRLADGCPLLAVLGSRYLAAGWDNDAVARTDEFRTKVFDGLLRTALDSQPESLREPLRRTAQALALVGPVPRNGTLLRWLSGRLQRSPIDLDEDLDRLNAAGLLGSNGDEEPVIRIVPDLLADAMLLEAGLHSGGGMSALVQELIRDIPSAYLPSAVRNLGQADWDAEHTLRAKAGALFDAAWRQFRDRFRAAGATERQALLESWSGVAIYQPRHTLELVRLARETFATSNDGAHAAARAPADVVTESWLPTLLQPVISHPSHAREALEILWSLIDPGTTEFHPGGLSPTKVIVRAAEFARDHPGSPESEAVLSWFESLLPWNRPAAQADSALGNLSILPAVLDPIFERVRDRSWCTTDRLHIGQSFIPPEDARPIRMRVLGWVERMLDASNPGLQGIAVSILRRATRSVPPIFGEWPTDDEITRWQPDRLAALGVLQGALRRGILSPVIRCKVQSVLRGISANERDDPAIRRAADQMLAGMADDFELLLLDAMSGRLPGKGDDLAAATRAAALRIRDVAAQALTLWSDPTDFCHEIARRVRQAQAEQLDVDVHGFLAQAARLSAEVAWQLIPCLLHASDGVLDPALPCLLDEVARHPDPRSPPLSQLLLEQIPVARPGIVARIVDFLGWRGRENRGLSPDERTVLDACLVRREPEVTRAIALSVYTRFDFDAHLGLGVLARLKPESDEETGRYQLRALAHFLESLPDDSPDLAHVRDCLRSVVPVLGRLGDFEHQCLARIAQRLPRLVYEVFDESIDSGAPSDSVGIPADFASNVPPLGKFPDPGFVGEQIERQWASLVRNEARRRDRQALLRSLLNSDPAESATRHRTLIARCDNEEELRIAAEILSPMGSRFCLEQPDEVRAFLARALELGVLLPIRRGLLNSALGGMRTWPETPWNRHDAGRLERATELSRIHSGDACLGPFYADLVGGEKRIRASLVS